MLALGGCSLFGSSAYFETVVELPFQPELAAWVVADVCRVAYPHADPSPLHAYPPVVSDGDREFLVSLARARADSGYRVAMNARITRPRRVRIGERIGLDLPRVVPTGRYTQAGSTGLASIEIEVRPTAGGCSVDIALSGEAAEGRLASHLLALFELVSVCEAAGELIGEGEWIAAERYLGSLDPRIESGCCARHRPIAALIHIHRALIRERRGELGDARNEWASAMAADPDDHRLLARLAAIDERTARREDARRGWDRLAELPELGLVAPAIDSYRRRNRHDDRPDWDIALERSAKLFAEGDLQGALNWAQRAYAADGNRRGELVQLLTQLQRARGMYREAFAIGLAQLDENGFDAELLSRLVEDSRSFGDPSAGLRLLARHWRKMVEATPERADALFTRLVADTGPRLASRILMAEGRANLAGRLLPDWRGLDPTGVDLFARVESLRQNAPYQAPTPARLDLEDRPFGDAPGITPAK